MAQAVICDGCGEQIDQTVSYYTGQVTIVQMLDGVLTSGGTVQIDYHTEHLPQQMNDLSMKAPGDVN